jgi:hypothetical protein
VPNDDDDNDNTNNNNNDDDLSEYTVPSDRTKFKSSPISIPKS